MHHCNAPRALNFRSKLIIALALLCIGPASALSADKPSIYIVNPYSGRINEPIPVTVFVVPPPDSPVSIKMTADVPGITFSESHFTLKGSEKKFLTVLVKTSPPSGLAYIYLNADGFDESEAAIDVGFDGHMKPSWSEPLSYDAATTLSLVIVDKDGKPAPPVGGLQLTLETSDGVLEDDKGPHPFTLKIPSGSRASPQFRLKPRFARGGNIHLTAMLTAEDSPHVLAEDQFVFVAQPAWWLPVLLALFGGSLHAIYKIVRLPSDGSISAYACLTIIITSWIAAFIGYLFADFDLLGLKLDPTVLRTYAIAGLLFSYIGIDGILSNSIHKLGKRNQDQVVPKHAPKKEVPAHE